MKPTFGGASMAKTYAEEYSRKNRTKVWVVKSNLKGICYRVATSESQIKPTEKVMYIYENGQIIK